MIIGLTIFLMILAIWSIFSINLCIESGEMNLDYNYDGLLVTIAKLYWWGIGILVVGFILFIFCYLISYNIVCDSTNGDYPTCEKEDK